MTEFENLGADEKTEIVILASRWYREHIHHVIKLVRKQTIAYPPSGLDLFCPELWTSAHWKWFTDTYVLCMVKD
jgi:hypothetical protein